MVNINSNRFGFRSNRVRRTIPQYRTRKDEHGEVVTPLRARA